ncbi:MAG: hypothetical protein JEZ04_10750 [Spirochaetales bacterium]|nr:hypothetical protein [Spirochaetales bacterium]
MEKLRKKLIKKIFVKYDFIIYKNKEAVDIFCDIKIQKVNSENVSDVLSFENVEKLKNINRLIENRDIGYYAYYKLKCVHRSWVKLGPQEVNVIDKYSLKLGKDDIYIHYCATARDFRGRNYYPAVLSYISKKFPTKIKYIVTLTKKKSANSSVRKAGFIPFKRIIYIRFFNKIWIKTII